VQKFQCCDAAKLKMHSGSRIRLTFRHSSLTGSPMRRIWNPNRAINICENKALSLIMTQPLPHLEMAVRSPEINPGMARIQPRSHMWSSSQKISMRGSHAGFDIRMNKRSLYGGPGRWIGPRHAIAVREAKDSGCRASNRDPTSSSDAIIQTRLAARRDGTGVPIGRACWRPSRRLYRRGACCKPGPTLLCMGLFSRFLS